MYARQEHFCGFINWQTVCSNNRILLLLHRTTLCFIKTHYLICPNTFYGCILVYCILVFLYAKRNNCANSAPFNSIASRNFYMGVLKFPLSYVCDINTDEGEGQWDCHEFASKGVEFYMFKTSLECNKGEVVTTLCPGATELTRNG